METLALLPFFSMDKPSETKWCKSVVLRLSLAFESSGALGLGAGIAK